MRLGRERKEEEMYGKINPPISRTQRGPGSLELAEGERLQNHPGRGPEGGEKKLGDRYVLY